MIRIAICDDEEFWLNQAQKLICDFLGDRLKEYQIDCFNSAKSLLNVIFNKMEYIDILILDIDIPQINGFEAAQKIKDKYPDVILLFFTAHEQYVYESFKFQPFRYIRKEFYKQEMKLALSDALRVIDRRSEKSIILKTLDESRMIGISDIMYFETDKRRCNIYLSDGNTLNVRKTIKELIAEIASDDFVQIHSGAVVNAKYIKSYSNFDITLDNNIRLIVSRSHIKDVKNTVMRFWSNRL